MSTEITVRSLTADILSISIVTDPLDDPVLSEFVNMLIELSNKNDLKAYSHYCRMTSTLLSSDCLRVSGSIFGDYLIKLLLGVKNPFSIKAASGVMDIAVYNAMARDISVLCKLISLAPDIPELFSMRSSNSSVKNDVAAQMSTRLWSGDDSPRTIQDTPRYVQSETLNLPSWDYGDFEPYSLSASSEYSELVSKIMDGASDSLTGELWSYFGRMGCGIASQHRLFEYRDNTLIPINSSALEIPLPFTDTTAESIIYENALDFMRGGEHKNVFISGQHGMGKTSVVLSVANEYDDINLVYVNGDDILSMYSLFDELSLQPKRYIVLADDVDCYMDFINELLALETRQPENVILYCTATSPEAGYRFPYRINITLPELDAFAEYILDCLQSEGVNISLDDVKDSCANYSITTKQPFTYIAAMDIIESLKNSD